MNVGEGVGRVDLRAACALLRAGPSVFVDLGTVIDRRRVDRAFDCGGFSVREAG